MPPDEPKLFPSVVSSAEIKTINCSKLHDQFRAKIGSKVSITVTPCKINGSPYNPKSLINVPCLDVMLSAVALPDFDQYLVQVDYTEGALRPDTLMTRAEFLMELLDIIETMRRRLSPTLEKTSGRELDTAIHLIRNIYSVTELTDLRSIEDQMKIHMEESELWQQENK